MEADFRAQTRVRGGRGVTQRGEEMRRGIYEMSLDTWRLRRDGTRDETMRILDPGNMEAK